MYTTYQYVYDMEMGGRVGEDVCHPTPQCSALLRVHQREVRLNAASPGGRWAQRLSQKEFGANGQQTRGSSRNWGLCPYMRVLAANS